MDKETQDNQNTAPGFFKVEEMETLSNPMTILKNFLDPRFNPYYTIYKGKSEYRDFFDYIAIEGTR